MHKSLIQKLEEKLKSQLSTDEETEIMLNIIKYTEIIKVISGRLNIVVAR